MAMMVRNAPFAGIKIVLEKTIWARKGKGEYELIEMA